jgi:Nif-specific regulatory protein
MMRARLIVSSGEARPRVCELQAGATVNLGRSRENTIVLEDRHASRNHAQILTANGRWFIRPLNTTNGTRVEGQLIAADTELRDGHEISIGAIRLQFRFDLAPTDEMPPLPPGVEALESEVCPTELHADDLTALFRFLTASLNETTPHRLVSQALDVVRRQTRADLAGFLGLEDPDFKIVLPDDGHIDKHLSQHLTQQALSTGKAVWLGPARRAEADSDSLLNFRDALCVPLQAAPALAEPGAPAGSGVLGALHVYKNHRPFHEREVRFCEVLAASLAGALNVLSSRRALEADNSRLREHAASAGSELIGSSPCMRALRAQIARLADCPCTVLIVGESGVGKELVALGLHRQSRRQREPLVPVNCAAITASMPESELFGHKKGSFTGATRDHAGFFLQADMGTLFLDEIGELSLEIQAKLLRALETKKFRPVGASSEVKADVRILAATNRDLEREVREGNFRKDLLYRLKISTVEVPPLREHPEDIPELTAHFLAHLNAEYRRRVTLSPTALERLKLYSWPGNVRQLRSVLEAAVAMAGACGTILLGDLHLEAETRAPSDGPPCLNLAELEAWAIRAALEQTGGNKTQAARILGIHRDTLISKLKKPHGEVPEQGGASERAGR